MPDGDLFYATAVGRYYKVYKDGVYVSQHTTEREAADRCHNLCFLFPESDIKYIHEYEVKVGLTDAGITEAKDYGTPVDQPPTISSTPSPSFTVGILATYDMKQHVTDDGVSTVTYTIQNVLPNGLDMNETTGILTYDGVEPSSTSAHTLTATDAVGSAISSSFDVQVSETPDVTAPNTPTGLAAGSETSSQITLSWNAATDPNGATGENVSGIANYKLYRDTNLVASPTELATVDNNLQSETSYDYQVSAVDNAGNESPLSSTVSASTTAAAAYVPGEPWGYKVNNDGFGISQGGTFIDGGRGSDPVYVTNLDASGAGSYNAAITRSSPAQIVFDIGGVCNTSSSSGQRIYNTDNLTIWGNTAPAGTFNIHGLGARHYIRRDNIIMKHVRLRVFVGTPSANVDAIELQWYANQNADQTCENNLIENCSFALSSDETFGVYGNPPGTTSPRNINYYKCLAAYPIASIGGSPHGFHGIFQGLSHISVIECILAYGTDRPLLRANPYMSYMNNYRFMWVSNESMRLNDQGTNNFSRIAIENNVWRGNPDGVAASPGSWNAPNNWLVASSGLPSGVRVYSNGNDTEGRGVHSSASGNVDTNDLGYIKPDGYSTRLLDSSTLLTNSWLDSIGANPGNRDSLDNDAINGIKNPGSSAQFVNLASQLPSGVPNPQSYTHVTAPGGLGTSLQNHLENQWSGWSTRHDVMPGYNNRTKLEVYLDTFVNGVPT